MWKSPLVLSSLIAATCGQSAFAQDANPWAGFYVGVSYSTAQADQEYESGAEFDLEGQGFGLMLGYNHAAGPWVIGAELSYSPIEVGHADGDPYYFESFLDLKARGGYAIDSVLLYGSLGGTFTKWNEGGGSAFDGDGLMYGIGADYLVTPQFVVGAEYSVRDVESDWNDAGGIFDADLSALSLRAAYKF